MKLWIVSSPYGGGTFPRVFDNERDALIAWAAGDDYDTINIRTLNATDQYGDEHQAEESVLARRALEHKP